MIYKKHDSVYNFHNASGTRDERAMYDLIMNDIADTLVHHRQLFVDGIVNSGIPANRDMGNPELIRKFVEAINVNPQMGANMAKLISYKNTKGTGVAIPEASKSKMNFYGQSYNAYGGLGIDGVDTVGMDVSRMGYAANIHNTGYLGADGKSNAGVVGSIADLGTSIIGLFSTKGRKEAQATETQNKLIDLATAKMNAAAAAVSSKKALIFLGGILVISIAGILYFKMKK